MVFGDEREVVAVFQSDSLRNPPDWPGVIVGMPIPVPLGLFSLVGGFSGLLWAGGFGAPPLSFMQSSANRFDLATASFTVSFDRRTAPASALAYTPLSFVRRAQATLLGSWSGAMAKV